MIFLFGQNSARPDRHSRQAPHTTWDSKATRSPTLKPVTLLPTATTVPVTVTMALVMVTMVLATVIMIIQLLLLLTL